MKKTKHASLIHWCKDAVLIPFRDQTGSLQSNIKGLTVLFLFGTLLGLLMPKNRALPTLWYRTISSMVGYTYFLCWSVSFYPQVISNFQRRSTAGLSSDFTTLNTVGFTCYSAYTMSFFWSSTIREQYRERNGADSEITIQSNDVAFALHALLLCVVQLGQVVYYGGLNDQPLSALTIWFLGGVIICSVVYPCLIFWNIGGLSWLDYLYMLSFVKVMITTIKYLPQVMLNVRRKSTVGWSIWNVLLDFSGGLMSICQLILDSTDMKDFSGITGNWAKFGLGFVSIFFDIVFLLQHYVIYPQSLSESIDTDSLLLERYDNDRLV